MNKDAAVSDAPAAQLGSRALWTIKDAMRLLSASQSTVYRLAAAGKLELVKIEASSRITDESLRAYIDDLKKHKPKLAGRRRPTPDAA